MMPNVPYEMWELLGKFSSWSVIDGEVQHLCMSYQTTLPARFEVLGLKYEYKLDEPFDLERPLHGENHD